MTVTTEFISFNQNCFICQLLCPVQKGYDSNNETKVWKPFNTSSQRWIQHFLCLAVITLRSGGGRCSIRLKITDSQVLREPANLSSEFATSLFRPLISIPPRFSAGPPVITILTNAIHSDSDAVFWFDRIVGFDRIEEFKIWAASFIHIWEIFVCLHFICDCILKD